MYVYFLPGSGYFADFVFFGYYFIFARGDLLGIRLAEFLHQFSIFHFQFSTARVYGRALSFSLTYNTGRKGQNFCFFRKLFYFCLYCIEILRIFMHCDLCAIEIFRQLRTQKIEIGTFCTFCFHICCL